MSRTRRTTSLNMLSAPQDQPTLQTIQEQDDQVQENQSDQGIPLVNEDQTNQGVGADPQRPITAKGPDEEENLDPTEEFYRQIGTFVHKIKSDFSLVQFDSEQLLHVFQSNGLNCVSRQHLVKDPSLSEQTMQQDILEFVLENVSKIDKVVEFCQGLVKGTASPDRFEQTILTEISTSFSKFGYVDVNPVPRPKFLAGTLEFAVQNVSNEAADLLRRGEKQKYHEYSHVYQTASWLFDCGLELLRNLLVPSLPYNQVKSLAIVTTMVWRLVQSNLSRLVEVEQLGSENQILRTLAQQKYKRKGSVLYKGKDALDLETQAATITTKQVTERLKKQNQFQRGSSSFRSRGRHNSYFSSGGRSNSYGYSNFQPSMGYDKRQKSFGRSFSQSQAQGPTSTHQPPSQAQNRNQ